MYIVCVAFLPAGLLEQFFAIMSCAEYARKIANRLHGYFIAKLPQFNRRQFKVMCVM